MYVLSLQGVPDRFDDIVLAAGSAGAACGLAIANYLTGSKLKYVHSIPFATAILRNKEETVILLEVPYAMIRCVYRQEYAIACICVKFSGHIDLCTYYI